MEEHENGYPTDEEYAEAFGLELADLQEETEPQEPAEPTGEQGDGGGAQQAAESAQEGGEGNSEEGRQEMPPEERHRQAAMRRAREEQQRQTAQRAAEQARVDKVYQDMFRAVRRIPLPVSRSSRRQTIEAMRPSWHSASGSSSFGRRAWIPASYRMLWTKSLPRSVSSCRPSRWPPCGRGPERPTPGRRRASELLCRPSVSRTRASRAWRTF